LPHPGRGPRVGLVVGRVRRLHEPARQDHHHIDAGHVLRGGNRMHRAEAADEIRLGGVGTQEPESGRPNRGHTQRNAPRAPELPPHTEREDLSENRQAQAPKQWVSDGLAHFPTGPTVLTAALLSSPPAPIPRRNPDERRHAGQSRRSSSAVRAPDNWPPSRPPSTLPPGSMRLPRANLSSPSQRKH